MRIVLQDKAFYYAGVAQLVRASACHAEGRGFESRHSRHLLLEGGHIRFTPLSLLFMTCAKGLFFCSSSPEFVRCAFYLNGCFFPLSLDFGTHS